MAIANSLDWSVSSGIITNYNFRKNMHFHHPSFTSKIKLPYPLISLLFLNVNSKLVVGAKAAISCSSPVLEEHNVVVPIDDSDPVIELALNFQDFRAPSDGYLRKDDEYDDDPNCLVCGLLNDSKTERIGYDYYLKAKGRRDFTPRRETLKCLVRYLMRLQNWDSLYELCEDVMMRFNVVPDRSTCCKLIVACVRARKVNLVNSLLDFFLANDSSIALASFDLAMKGYNKLHMYSSTIVLYQRMKSAGLELDIACYAHVMEAYFKSGRYENVVTVFEELEVKKKVKHRPSKDYGKIYQALCESLGKLKRPFEALEYFREMSRKGVSESDSCELYSSLISSFARVREVKMAEELLQEAEEMNMLKDPALFLNLVLMYIKEGLMEKTLDVVETMKRVNVTASDCILCAIVNGFSKKRGAKTALRIYEELVTKGYEPGQVTYASILNMYSRLGLYSKAEMIFNEMLSKGFDRCVVAYSTMVAAYGKKGRTQDAIKLVAKMKERGCEPNVWIYNSLLDIYTKALNLRYVEKTWKEMKRKRTRPDRISYTTVISAYNRAQEFESCVRYYEEYKLNGGKIDKAMAGVMVSVFSKLNRVNELVELLQDVKIEGIMIDARFYRSAMGALRDAGLQVQARWLQENLKYT